MTPTETLLSRLEGVKPYGKGWRAICPACGGKNKSKLSVREGDNGGALVKCFAGCEITEIVGAAGLNLTDLFPPKDSQGKPQRGAFRYEALRELRGELNVAWVLLNDIARGRQIGAKDRARAGAVARKVTTLLHELG